MSPLHAIALLLLLALSYSLGYRRAGAAHDLIKADTVLVVDTIRDSIPHVVYERVVDVVPEPFAEYVTIQGDTIRDTIYVPVPITEKEYKTEDYRAIVSGYNPSLDYMELYATDRVITVGQKPSRWGVGIMAGYGVGKEGLSPYLGAGIYYRLF